MLLSLKLTKSQVRVVFGDQVCRDCGQRGDERLLSDFCHERSVETERKLLNFNCGKKKICSNCGEAWSRCVANLLFFVLSTCKILTFLSKITTRKLLFTSLTPSPSGNFLECGVSQTGPRVSG